MDGCQKSGPRTKCDLWIDVNWPATSLLQCMIGGLTELLFVSKLTLSSISIK